jgi:hypothetical protein
VSDEQRRPTADRAETAIPQYKVGQQLHPLDGGGPRSGCPCLWCKERRDERRSGATTTAAANDAPTDYGWEIQGDRNRNPSAWRAAGPWRADFAKAKEDVERGRGRPTAKVQPTSTAGETWAKGFRAGEEQAAETLGESGFYDAAKFLRETFKRERSLEMPPERPAAGEAFRLVLESIAATSDDQETRTLAAAILNEPGHRTEEQRAALKDLATELGVARIPSPGRERAKPIGDPVLAEYGEQSAEWQAGYDEAETVYHHKQADLRTKARLAQADCVAAVAALAPRFMPETHATALVSAVRKAMVRGSVEPAPCASAAEPDKHGQQVSKGGTSMRAAGEKPDPLGPATAMGGTRSDDQPFAQFDVPPPVPGARGVVDAAGSRVPATVGDGAFGSRLCDATSPGGAEMQGDDPGTASPTPADADSSRVAPCDEHDSDRERAWAFISPFGYAFNSKIVTRLAELLAEVRAAEREACAKVAEACAPAGLSDQWTAAQRAIAKRIRERTANPKGEK